AETGAAPLAWDGLRQRALLVPAAGGGVFLLAGVADYINQSSGARTLGQFFLSYLTSVVFWLSLPLGCMTLLNIQYLTGGKWGVYLRKFFEANTRTLPLLALLFLPVLIAPFLGHQSPYWWAAGHESEEFLKTPPEARHELEYRFSTFLSPGWFALWNVVWFAIWLGIIYLQNKWADEAERDRDPVKRARLTALAGPAIIVYALTITFACTHWVISLEVTWNSTMFPVIFAVNQLLSSLALCLAVLLLLRHQPPLNHYVRPNEQIH